MTDLERFKEFFTSMGVVHEVNFGRDKPTEEGKDIITVTQAHFTFRGGRYTGTEADEMGYFSKRM